jgi:hypothetical protein
MDGAISSFPHTSEGLAASLTKHRDNVTFYLKSIRNSHMRPPSKNDFTPLSWTLPKKILLR